MPVWSHVAWNSGGRTAALRRALIACLVLVLVLALRLEPQVHAQDAEQNSILAGSLFDDVGFAIVGARLTLKSTDARVYLARSNEKGEFRFPRLLAGRYDLEFDQIGFCKLRVTSIAIAAKEEKSLGRLKMLAPDANGNCPE
jgi:hypothetical protein